jgi:hypothetical protein
MSKITLTVTPPANFAENIKKRMLQVTESREFLSEVGQEIVADIKFHAKAGRGIVDGVAVEFEPLSSKTIESRKELREAGNATARPYNDYLSNLSMSGQLINSVKYSVIGNTIEVFASGQRQPYILKDGTRSSARIPTNEQLSKKHHDGAVGLPRRPFIGVRKEMRIRIIAKIREFIRRSLRPVFIK